MVREGEAGGTLAGCDSSRAAQRLSYHVAGKLHGVMRS